MCMLYMFASFLLYYDFNPWVVSPPSNCGIIQVEFFNLFFHLTYKIPFFSAGPSQITSSSAIFRDAEMEFTGKKIHRKSIGLWSREFNRGHVSKPLFSMAVISSLLHFTLAQTMNSLGKGPSPLFQF